MDLRICNSVAAVAKTGRWQFDAGGFRFRPKVARLALVSTGTTAVSSLKLPLRIDGIPDGMEAKPIGLVMAIESPDGVVWQAPGRPWMAS